MPLFINAEIARVRFMNVNAFQIPGIIGIQQGQIFCQNFFVLFLKYLPVFRVDFRAVFVIFPVVFHLVNEKQRQSLDAAGVEFALLLKVRADGLTNLYPAYVLFADIAENFSGVDLDTVCKCKNTFNRINIVDMISLILLHSFGKRVEVIINTYNTGFTIDGLIISDLEFQPGHRRFIRRNDNILKEEISISSSQIFDVKSLYLDFLDQLHSISVQCVKNINQIMMLFMRR